MKFMDVNHFITRHNVALLELVVAIRKSSTELQKHRKTNNFDRVPSSLFQSRFFKAENSFLYKKLLVFQCSFQCSLISIQIN